jgi:uncharacterized protein (DUF2141 family)
VTITLRGFRSDEGTVVIGVYPNAGSFANPRKAPYYNNKVRITQGKARVTFNLPKGNYAASMFHDENNNKEFDLNWIRIPKEGWGFSMDARPSPTWPDFKDAAFKVETDPVLLTINVNYGIL